jgi:8-amino-7-oxononanoate synthase
MSPRLESELERLKAEHLHRSLRLPAGRDFTSNDYLGLSRHPALREAAARALEEDRALGAGGSRLLRGHHPRHQELEQRAAAFFGCERALYFGSGYLANLALFSTLPSRHDAVIFDERIHASMKEGIHAAPAERFRARHNDLSSFEDNLRRARGQARDIWIAVESIYSMDGDRAPLTEILAMAERYDATLIVDEAHATGVFGPSGRGLCEGLDTNRLVTLHTCGKALGAAGALVCGPQTVIDYLVNKARPFIYSTAPPPLLAAAVSRALELVDEEPWRRGVLQARLRFAADILQKRLGSYLAFAGTQIVPVILGDDARALAVADAMQKQGFDIRAIRPPTVPAGTARLRIAIHAEHSEADIAEMAAVLAEALQS